MNTIDLNCDLGESFGAYQIGNDEAILNYVTSVNVACGFHAGDPTVMRKTVKLALEKKVKVGAHPGLQDLIGFGRRNMNSIPHRKPMILLYTKSVHYMDFYNQKVVLCSMLNLTELFIIWLLKTKNWLQPLLRRYIK